VTVSTRTLTARTMCRQLLSFPLGLIQTGDRCYLISTSLARSSTGAHSKHGGGVAIGFQIHPGAAVLGSCYGTGGDLELSFAQIGLFHHRSFAGFTGTKRDRACPTKTSAARSKTMTPRNAQILIAPSTSDTGNATKIPQTAKIPAINRDFVAKCVPHDAHRAGRVFEAKNRLEKEIVRSPQFGH